MMALRPLSFTCLLLCALFSGCVTHKPFDTSRITALGAVSFTPAQVAKKAFGEPDGSETTNFGASVPQMTGGGRIPSLVGSAIDAGIHKSQQGKFRKKYATSWDEIVAVPPPDVGAALTERARQALQSHELFGPLMREGAAAHFKSTLLDCGLRRFSVEEEETLLKLGVQLEVTLVDAKGKKLITGTVWARSEDTVTLDQLAAEPARWGQLYEQVYASFELELTNFLNRKLGLPVKWE